MNKVEKAGKYIVWAAAIFAVGLITFGLILKML